MRKQIPAGVFFALGLAFASMIACSLEGDGDEIDDNNFREDVIHCEDALARLAKCCPDFDASDIGCDYYYSHQNGCGTLTTQSISPALSTAESRCVREKSCEDLVSKGVCKRAKAARAYMSKVVVDKSSTTDASTTTTKESGKHPPVCP